MPVLREFVGIDLGRETVPDATTLLKFRRLLNDNDLTRALFDEVGHKKVRYKGLAKNTAQLHSLFALANLLLARKRLFALDARGAS